jgi:hypothetical protein
VGKSNLFLLYRRSDTALLLSAIICYWQIRIGYFPSLRMHGMADRKLSATRVGREWRFSRSTLIQWVANGAAADQLSVALNRGRVAKRK